MHNYDVLTWIRFLYYWLFVWWIQQSMLDTPHKGSVIHKFEWFFDVSLNKLQNQLWSSQQFGTIWCWSTGTIICNLNNIIIYKMVQSLFHIIFIFSSRCTETVQYQADMLWQTDTNREWSWSEKTHRSADVESQAIQILEVLYHSDNHTGSGKHPQVCAYVTIIMHIMHIRAHKSSLLPPFVKVVTDPTMIYHLTISFVMFHGWLFGFDFCTTLTIDILSLSCHCHIISVYCICVAELFTFISNFRWVLSTSVITTVVIMQRRWWWWWQWWGEQLGGLKEPKPWTGRQWTPKSQWGPVT